MPISCTVGDLIESSKCLLSCTDEGQRDAMKVWLLAQIAGVEATPGFLLEQSKCLNCLNEGQLKAIQAWLLCQISNDGGGGGCPSITVDPETIPDGVCNVAYSQLISASGGSGPYAFVVTSGALPIGLSLSSVGLLSGTPNDSGTFNFTVTAVDSNGCTGNRSYELVLTGTQSIQFSNWSGDISGLTITEEGPGSYKVCGSFTATTVLNLSVDILGLCGAEFITAEGQIEWTTDGVWQLQSISFIADGNTIGGSGAVVMPAAGFAPYQNTPTWPSNQTSSTLSISVNMTQIVGNIDFCFTLSITPI